MKPLITVPLLLMLAAFIAMMAFRNVGWGLALAWAGATFLALGYVRMLGYASLASAAVLMVSVGRIPLPIPWTNSLKLTGWVVVAVAACFVWGKMIAGKMEEVLGEGQHVTGWGHTPNFDPTTLDWVKTELPSAKVFTTIDSGSAALLAWDFEKPVFMDGFFAPHTREVLEDYSAARKNDDVVMLHKKYGITAAIIPNSSQSWREVFLFAPGWRPVALGIGSTVFLHESQTPTPAMPAILYSASDLGKSSDLFIHHTTLTTFSVLGHSMRLKGGFPVSKWTAQNPEFFEESRRLAEDLAKRNARK